MKHSLALIGCGGMAKTHVDRIAPLLDRVRLTAAVDVVPERARAVAEHFPGARAAADYRDVLGDVNSVLLVLPHHLHHPVAMDCLAAGKHVLVEKPMANSERECLDMIAAARKAQRVLMVAYCMRFHPLAMKMKELLDGKEFGECFQLSIWTEQLTHYPPGHWALNAATLGGGQFFSHGCHYVDLLLWFLGNPTRGFHVGTNFGTPWMEKEGTSNMVMEFEGGRLSYHFGTWGARGSRLRYSFHAHCTEAMLDADISGGKLVVRKWKQEDALVMEAGEAKPTQEELRHFLDCIDSGRRPETDGPRSLQSLRAIWRMYEAEQQGAAADLRGLGLERVNADGTLATTGT